MPEEVIVGLFDSRSKCPDEIMRAIKDSRKCQNEHWIGFDGGSFSVESERYANWNDNDSVQVGVVSIKTNDFQQAILSEKYAILTDEILKQAVSLLKQRNIADISEDEIDRLVKIFAIDRENVKKEVNDRVMKNFVLTPETAEFYIQSLLECDTARADLEKYDRKCLENVNSGHWELWTKMEFINFKKFLRYYNSRIGRPETSINDLRVSHAADKDLKSCDNNSFFDSFFYDIKQWCGDDRRSVKLIHQQNSNTEMELPPFVSLGKDDFNPLELYAYYLGLYINNMHEGIYLDYVLSFPVTYKLDVKTKILESFQAGLWKSMPETIQKNKDVSKRFRVRMGVSEPAAYAITALQGYRFNPEDQNEKYLYSIFDFGGGTTDFDFGIWHGVDDTVREKMDIDYVIEHINSEGDKYL